MYIDYKANCTGGTGGHMIHIRGLRMRQIIAQSLSLDGGKYKMCKNNG